MITPRERFSQREARQFNAPAEGIISLCNAMCMRLTRPALPPSACNIERVGTAIHRARLQRLPHSRRLAVCIATLVVLLGVVVAARADSTEPLLEEVIAGAQSNLQLIQYGMAVYKIRVTQFASPSRPAPSLGRRGKALAQRIGASRATKTSESDLTVIFDYPRIQYTRRGTGRIAGANELVVEERVIQDAERTISYMLPRGESDARFHNVIIEPPSNDERPIIEPRQQLPRFSIAENIRGVRATGGAKIDAVQGDDGLIRITIAAPNFTINRWVAPKSGYCVVRSESEAERYEASARQVGNGAFILESRLVKSFQRLNGVLTPRREEEATLVDIDLDKRPDGGTFTLAALSLPIGARVQDRIHGREYRYGVNAVNEADVNPPKAVGPMHARRWAWIVWVGGGLGLFAAGFVSRRIYAGRARRVPDDASHRADQRRTK